MSLRIGIPRALLYYEYATLWSAFFHELDAEVIISGETNKQILNEGAGRVADEACLPVKVFFGHAAQLSSMDLDFLYTPRIVSVEKKTYICPKLMGLPDMLLAGRKPTPSLLKPTLNLVRSDRAIAGFFKEVSSELGCSYQKVKKAWESAQKEHVCQKQGRYRRVFWQDAKTTIFILAHPYLIHDRYLNLNILEKLKKMDCRVVIPDEIPSGLQEAELKYLPKQLFWTFGRTQLGSSLFFARQTGEKGVIILSSFGCGIDSFIDNMVIRRLKTMQIPHLSITLDEHSGEAGVDTRIEAFVDMLRWRRVRNEDNISTYGSYLGNNEGATGLSGVGCCCSTTFQ